MTRPLTCGKNMADFTWEELRAMPVTLTEEERKLVLDAAEEIRQILPNFIGKITQI